MEKRDEKRRGGKVEVWGELSYRILKNYARLEDMTYRPENLFREDGWPGDKVGRVYLSWILLWKTTGRKPAFLGELREAVKENLNEKGYFGEMLPRGEADEQQLSGHNWFLRGLLEDYLLTKDREAAALAERLVKNLYLPLRGMYPKYPVLPDGRNDRGRASGEIVGANQDGWRLSSDIGCAFMPLDGLSQYYEIFRDGAVKALLEEMVGQFLGIDFVGVSMQTHASLSAVRGMVRLYRCTGQESLLGFAEHFFRLYREEGMTENYANYNWFGRPLWTEPCAIVDSYLLALQLFWLTKKKEYADDASRIWYNGLGHAQRSNGGFGCDTCAGAGEEWDSLAVRQGDYEAHWCCTMRGSEGLARAAESAVLREGDRLFFLNYVPMGYEAEDISLKVSTGYPYEGEVLLEMEAKTPVTVSLYLPEGTDRSQVRLFWNGSPVSPMWEDGFVCAAVSGKGNLRLCFALRLLTRDSVAARHEGYVSLWHGDLLLGAWKKAEDKGKRMLPTGALRAAYQGKGRYRIGEWEAEPIGGTIYREKEEMLANRFQVMYTGIPFPSR